MEFKAERSDLPGTGSVNCSNAPHFAPWVALNHWYVLVPALCNLHEGVSGPLRRALISHHFFWKSRRSSELNNLQKSDLWVEVQNWTVEYLFQMSSSPAHHAMHSATWVRVLARHLEACGIDPKPTLIEAGFTDGAPAGPDERVPFESIATFFELAANLCDDDLLGFHFGQKIDVRDAGLIAYVGINAPTLGDFIHNIAAYARVFGDAVTFDLNSFDTEGRLTWFYHLPPSIPRRQYVESFATTCVSTLRQITNAPIWCEHVSFIHPRNAQTDEHERYFGCGVSFGQQSNTITFKVSDLNKTIVNADSKLLGLLKGIASETLNRSQANRPGIQEQVERAIMSKLASGDVSIATVASELGISARSLSRRLAETELTFTGLVSNLREALATRYLRDSDLSVIQIAFLLGYSGASTFSTAYKQWTGQSPRDFKYQ